MENKSLNVCTLRPFGMWWWVESFYMYLSGLTKFYSEQIFNSKFVLASPETATDADYAAILGAIGHEVCGYYFLCWII